MEVLEYVIETEADVKVGTDMGHLMNIAGCFKFTSS